MQTCLLGCALRLRRTCLRPSSGRKPSSMQSASVAAPSNAVCGCNCCPVPPGVPVMPRRGCLDTGSAALSAHMPLASAGLELAAGMDASARMLPCAWPVDSGRFKLEGELRHCAPHDQMGLSDWLSANGTDYPQAQWVHGAGGTNACCMGTEQHTREEADRPCLLIAKLLMQLDARLTASSSTGSKYASAC